MRPSHSHENSSILVHASDVAHMMLQRAESSLTPQYCELARLVCEIVGYWHDILKDTADFEKKLLSHTQIDRETTRHTGGSALLSFCAAQQILEKDEELLQDSPLRPYIPTLIFSVVAAHHDKIKQIDIAQEHSKAIKHWQETRSDASVQLLHQLEKDFKVTLDKKNFDNILTQVPNGTVTNLWPNFSNIDSKLAFELLLLCRIFLGALAVADEKSACAQSSGKTLKIEDFKPETARIMSPIISSQGNGLNKLRSDFQTFVCHNASSQAGAYLIKAPTGLGKTFAAAKIINKIQEDDGPCKVFYIAPTVTILRQVYDEFKPLVVNDEPLQIHYMAQEDNKELYTQEETLQRELKRNTWDAGMIITTYHRLIALLANVDKQGCYNLYGLHKAIFIFDESQFISHIQYPAFSSLISALVEICGARVFFMSATPQNQEMWQKAHEIFRWQNIPELKTLLDKDTITNLEKDVLVNGRRVIHSCPNISYLEDLKTELLKYRKEHPKHSILVLLNLAKDAKRLYKLLLDEGHCPDYFITSYLRPKDIRNNLENANNELKEAEKNGESNSIIMIATSIVQAGVDLDFDAGFIELNDLATFRQGCGRVGRTYNKKRGSCEVFCFELLDNEIRRCPSWFRQRFGTNTELSEEKKIYRNVVQESINEVLNSNRSFSDLDIEEIENKYHEDIFKIYNECKKKVLSGFPPSYKSLLGIRGNNRIGFTFDAVYDVLTDPLNEKDSACPFLVLFLQEEKEEREVYEKVNRLRSELEELERALKKHDESFFELLEKYRKKKKELHQIIAPFALRRFDILNNFEQSNHTKLRFFDFYLLYCNGEQYDENSTGWQFDINNSEDAGITF